MKTLMFSIYVVALVLALSGCGQQDQFYYQCPIGSYAAYNGHQTVCVPNK